MSQDDKILESLITGGVIGAALGALLSKDKEEGGVMGAFLGAVISGTLHANKEAQKTNQPVLIAEKGKLYRVINGKNIYIRDLPTSSRRLSKPYKLK